ncbi:hypothetical protein IWW45_000950 [Coemansia sp. RSA 485]|nr:hypothetical protein IWW45_000950 [Coemansia sp. RSA 485]
MSCSSISTLSNSSFARSAAPEPFVSHNRQDVAVYMANERPANVIIPKHRDAGIGGYSNFYSHSGIGGHVRQHADMGIGKACLSQSPRRQERSSPSPAPSSSPFRRVLSFASLRSLSRSPSATTKKE